MQTLEQCLSQLTLTHYEILIITELLLDIYPDHRI